MLPNCTRDLWEYLQETNKTIVLYGMGNGADKILSVLAERKIPVRGVFASDGFARGNLFHGMPVRTWSDAKAEFGKENVIVLLSFGSSRPEVLENILRIRSEAELYAPDVPAFGDTLFTRAFYEEHIADFAAARALLSDEESRRIFDNILSYKLSGDIGYLLDAESDEDEIWNTIIHPENVHTAADLGAYNGDTVRQLLEKGNPDTIWAMEPDARNYKKLEAYAEGETRARIIPVNAGAWNEETTLFFDKSGNRNASFEVNRSQTLADRPAKMVEVKALPLDAVLDGARVDYIKYDVEGSEREALDGSVQTLINHAPTLLVSLYHRSEDLFALPLHVHKIAPHYKGFYLRRMRGIPAWDINLYVTKENI
jgi:FkbM family methyltransferase